MIVGDSITEGSAGDYTLQYFLYKHLVADGIRPIMVGPNHWLFDNVAGKEGSTAYADPNFGRANDAHWGKAYLQEKDVIRAKVAKYRPDYLLVLLGVDDLFWFGVSQRKMAANLASFIASARAAQPHIRIVLGTIPPDVHTQTSPTFAASVAAFNQTIAFTASHRSTARSPIAVARDDIGIDVTNDYWDGTHPNTRGQIKIAAAFADALAAKFHFGRPYPKPYPKLPVGPLTPPQLTATPSSQAGQIDLSWTPPPGANGFFIYIRDVTQNQAKFKRLPLPLPTSPFDAGLLTSGDVYAFKVQACKGIDCHAFSNVATATAP
jgi:lysophospholipase L1-like esterase